MNMDRREEIGEAIAKNISHTIAKKIAIGIALLFAFVFFIAFGGVLVLLLWNWLITDIFHLRRITLWEALGLLLLCRILFGGFGTGTRASSERRRGKEHGAWWKTQPAVKPSETTNNG
jgi:hypothetical protein